MDYPLLLGIFPQVFLDGIILGFMYALIALGYTMVYGVLEFINFAHSEIFIVGAFVGVELLLGLKSVGLLDGLPWPLVLFLTLVAGMAASGLLAVTVERVAYRPLRNAPRLIPLISAIGISFFLQDLIRLFESLWRNAFNLVYPTIDVLNLRFELTETIDVSVKSLVVIVAVLGGIGNIPGAMLGGLVLGLLEAFAASYLSLLTGGAFGAEYKDIFAFSVLIVILIFRPKGLLGEIVRERA